MHERMIREKYQVYLELCSKENTPAEYILSYEEYVEKIKQVLNIQVQAEV